MENASIRTHVDEFIRALHRVEREGEAAVEALARLFAPGARIVNPMTRRAQHDRQGDGEVSDFWAVYAAQRRGSESQFAHVTVGDHAAGLFWTTHGAGGARYDGATLLEFDDAGAITLLRGYFDPQELRDQRQAA